MFNPLISVFLDTIKLYKKTKIKFIINIIVFETKTDKNKKLHIVKRNEKTNIVQI